MTNEYHKPFIQSLILVAFVTVFTMVSTRYIITSYAKYKISPAKTSEYSSQKSGDSVISSLVK